MYNGCSMQTPRDACVCYLIQYFLRSVQYRIHRFNFTGWLSFDNFDKKLNARAEATTNTVQGTRVALLSACNNTRENRPVTRIMSVGCLANTCPFTRGTSGCKV